MNLTARSICSGLFYALNRFCLFYTDNCVIMIDVTDVNFLKDNDIGMKKPENRKNANSKLTFTHICIRFLLVSILFLFLIMALRGFMKVANRTSFISQRLDDYPSLYDNYLMENDEWWNWWQEQDYEKRADLAAFIFDSNDTIESEEDKLAYISEVVNAEKV